MRSLLYLLFVQASLIIPGYVAVKKIKYLRKQPGIELMIGYVISIVFFALLAVSRYALNISEDALRIIGWIVLLSSLIIFIKDKYYRNIWELRFPILCVLLMSILATAFVGLSFRAPQTFLPDPQAMANRNYGTLNVKVLNIAQTQANDNYIPYRQAQFFVNRSDPARDSFIDEWGVHFFQRTPLMGAVTANYFNLLDDNPPVDYSWSASAQDTDATYLKFQLISHVLNSLFIIPAFFLLTKLFSKKAAVISCLFMVSSQYFLYNSVFSWPKSFVAFFILLAWLLLLEKKLRFTILAGAVSGIAYLTHDLAVLYIGASVLLLLFNKRIREVFIYLGSSAIFALPWLFISGFLYRKPSTFMYYPFSVRDIPQPNMRREVMQEFFNTSPLRILYIRLHNFFYMLSPYQLFTSEGGQDAARRAWALGQYSISGALGFGLIIPAILGVFKKLANRDFWILVLTPVAMATFVIGWPKGLAALHYAEGVVILLTGLAVACLLKFKNSLWLLLAFIANAAHLVYFVIFSFDFATRSWLTHFGDISRILVMGAIVLLTGYMIRQTTLTKKSKIAKFSGI